uniref:C2H2-type domain-containing protein n=1 Tax=Cyprinus carpio TaxID=7962 RepID=A0A8C2CN90_CYPCA
LEICFSAQYGSHLGLCTVNAAYGLIFCHDLADLVFKNVFVSIIFFKKWVVLLNTFVEIMISFFRIFLVFKRTVSQYVTESLVQGLNITIENTDNQPNTTPNTDMIKKSNDGLFRCKTCGKCFELRWKFINHVRAHVKHYKCSHCEKRFTMRSCLIRHAAMHTGAQLFKCDICSKSFVFQASLEKHKHLHTAEKTVTSALTVHQRVHTKEKPYSCEVCGKRFGYSSSIQMHMRIHTGERPFGCDVCGKTFSQAVHLRTHQRVHTGLKSFSCESCGKKMIIDL